MRSLVFHSTHGLVCQDCSRGLAILFVAAATLLSVSFEVTAKPKAPRTGMHDCTVGELEAVRNQAGQDVSDQCTIAGGTMYCDKQGFFCCKTSPNGAEVCSGQDWGERRIGTPIPGMPQAPLRATPGKPPVMRRGIEGEQASEPMPSPPDTPKQPSEAK